MAQKLWEKNVQVDQEVDTFTVGKDREMDLYLAKYDVLGLDGSHHHAGKHRAAYQRGTDDLACRTEKYLCRCRLWPVCN